MKCALVPQSHVELLEQLAKEMAVVEGEAQRTVSHQAVLKTSFADVAEKSGDANNHLSLMQGFLATL